jgi:murein DD-endopeptidase MepM/ murein hydrolase activator NlpD
MWLNKIWNSAIFQWLLSVTIALVLIILTINPSSRRDITEIKSNVVDNNKKIDDIFVVLKVLVQNDSIMNTKLNHFPSNPLDLKNMSKVSSLFKYRINPISNEKEFHAGIDYSVTRGTPVYAAAEGIVEEADIQGGYGRMIRINHENGYKTTYAHLDSIKVNKWQYVYQGDLIGTVGRSGWSTGNHLHYEISYLDKKINPIVFTR